MARMVAHLRDGKTILEGILLTQELVADQPEVHAWLDRAMETAHSGVSDITGIASLGEGWVAEEALAISLFCALRAANFEEGVIMAVNHGGDSDSTGSMTGQLLGVAYGDESIPLKWREGVELREVVTRIADQLYRRFVGT